MGGRKSVNLWYSRLHLVNFVIHFVLPTYVCFDYGCRLAYVFVVDLKTEKEDNLGMVVLTWKPLSTFILYSNERRGKVEGGRGG